MKTVGRPDKLINELLKLDRDKVYTMEVKEPKNKRTLQQNAYMWKLINEIAKVQYQDEMEVYCQVLEEANAKYTWLKGLKETKEELLQVFRAVKITRYDEDGFAIFKCFYGSSKMNTKEMSELLEIVIAWATNLGIPTLDDLIIQSM